MILIRLRWILNKSSIKYELLITRYSKTLIEFMSLSNHNNVLIGIVFSGENTKYNCI